MKIHQFVLLAGLTITSFAWANHHEGKGTRESGMQTMFSEFDKDKDGKISQAEYKEGSDKLFLEIDTNKDSFISKDEMQAHHKATYDKYHSSMQERWKLADKDGDGVLTKAEAENADMPRIVRDFEKLDKNKDGKLSHQEVEAGMKKRHKSH